jgi:tRNA threonylcarbamoyladenosine biosynthesis protein TsaB
MNLLAVDTTSEGCSAALWKSGQLFERAILAPRGHTRHLLPMVREVTSQSGLDLKQLDGLAFGCGPGSFTGLRIATGVVQGLAWGLGVPVLPISSLMAVAAQAIRLGHAGEGDGLAVAFDARMKEVYWQCFVCHNNNPVALNEPQVSTPPDIVLPQHGVLSQQGPARWIGAGSGWAFADQFPEPVIARVHSWHEGLYPLASDIAKLAAAGWSGQQKVTASEAVPVYVRNTVTWKKLPGR